MNTFPVIKSPDGVYSCDIDVTVEEWKEILASPEITQQKYKDLILNFYNEEGHRASCKALSLKYGSRGKDAQRFNSLVMHYGRSVVGHLKRFRIKGTDGKSCYWPVLMCQGVENAEGFFEWTLRPEIVEAIEILGWNRKCTWIPFYMEMADKLLQFKDDRGPLLDIVYGLGKETVGYIRSEGGGRSVDIDPFTVFGIFNRYLSDDKRIDICGYFKDKLNIQAEVPIDFYAVPIVNNMKATFTYRKDVLADVPSLWDLFEEALNGKKRNLSKHLDIVLGHHGVKWNITMGLFWIRPYKYISLDSRNRDYLPSLGVEVFDEKHLDGEHYLALLHNVEEKIEAKEIKEQNIPEISYQAWMSDNMKTDKNYWLVGYTFGSQGSQLERFLKDGVWEGNFDENKKRDQRQLALIETFQKGDVIILKTSSTKGKKHDIPFVRIKGVGVVDSEIETIKGADETKCRCKVKYVGTCNQDIEGSAFGAYQQTVNLATSKVQDAIDFANSFLSVAPKVEPKPVPKYAEYVELLKEARNVVLTGAPGTGKTFMAQKIAEEMGCGKDEMCFVQFHPSYDYTDFVEGLRPYEKEDGQMGFERKDGVFKEFCKKAIKNMEDSEKSVEILKNELTWEETLQQFLDESIENGTVYQLSNGNEFTIEETKGHNIIIHNEVNEKTPRVAVNGDEILKLLTNEVHLSIVRDIRNYFNHKYGTQADSYAYVITKAVQGMKKSAPVVKVNKVAKKPFVFVIDEINRGEASKIFGELFYAIDPGYRGKKDICVKTQYQNLIPDTDDFAEGFYVPDNVYILATMNDIDRSVESMDFAMRRRFTWKEVTPADTIAMLDGLACASEAKATMERLNKVIAATDGLGAAYQIGASYFLKLGENGGNFKKLWKMNIEPLLKEYLRGFRKVEELMKEFEKAFFDKTETTENESELEIIDEN